MIAVRVAQNETVVAFLELFKQVNFFLGHQVYVDIIDIIVIIYREQWPYKRGLFLCELRSEV